MSIYLDNSTAARPSAKALSDSLPFLGDRFGVTSQPHTQGQQLFPAMEEAYLSIYKLLDASQEDGFQFCSSGAEAVNSAFLAGYFDLMVPTGRNHFLSGVTGDAPMILSLNRLEKVGAVGKTIPITAESVADHITPRTAMVSFSWANGLTGLIHPVEEISEVCKERGIRLHLDATHVLGKLFFELDDVGADVITFDGAPLHAPGSSGGIWTKKGVRSSPLILGRDLNVSSLVGLGSAANDLLETRDLICTETSRLRDRLEKGVSDGYSDTMICFQDRERLPHVTTLAFPGVANEALLYRLNEAGVLASIGGGKFQQLSLLLIAEGIEDSIAQTSISFSLSRETTEAEIDQAIQIIVEEVKALRSLSEAIL